MIKMIMMKTKTDVYSLEVDCFSVYSLAGQKLIEKKSPGCNIQTEEKSHSCLLLGSSPGGFDWFFISQLYKYKNDAESDDDFSNFDLIW